MEHVKSIIYIISLNFYLKEYIILTKELIFFLIMNVMYLLDILNIEYCAEIKHYFFELFLLITF